MMAKKKKDRTARRAIELFKDARFAKRVVKNKKVYDRNRDKKVVNETESAVPINAMGASSSTSGPVQTYDPLLDLSKKRLKKFSSMFKRKIPDGSQ
jgi:hypothetical protein